MARTLKFYGSSDDLFEIDGSKGSEPDEIGCYNRPIAVKVANDHGGLFVIGHYAPASAAGCWTIGVMQLDEDEPLPDWPMKWSAKGHSTVLTIEAPDSAIVSSVGKDNE